MDKITTAGRRICEYKSDCLEPAEYLGKPYQPHVGELKRDAFCKQHAKLAVPVVPRDTRPDSDGD